jgi:hypothetical protein
MTQTDRKIAALLIVSFRANYNRESLKLTSDVIVRKVKERGYLFSGAKLRAFLGTIRHHNLAAPGFIVSDNGGYWYTEDISEMRDFWESQRGRVIEIMLYEKFKMNPAQLLLEFLEHLAEPIETPETTELPLQ